MTSSRISGFKDLSIDDRRREHVAEPRASTLARPRRAGPGSRADASTRPTTWSRTSSACWASRSGIATNFIVDGRDVLVPMATEEPSVVAAASNLARMTRDARRLPHVRRPRR